MARGGQQRIPRPEGARAGGPPPWDGLAPQSGAEQLARLRTVLASRPAGPPPPGFDVEEPRPAAVLIPMFLEGGALEIVLTRRAAHLRAHTGEVAFPGGAVDPGESLEQAAVREAYEEVGIEPATVEIVGELDHLVTVGSRFTIAPFVGLLPARPVLRPNASEIERAFAVPVDELLGRETWREEIWDLPWGVHQMAFFEIEGDTVWGATGRILCQLLMILTGTG
jgi:8-oxo-dGTP pyrophosphatase MutT (NUDIX family)